MGTYTVTNIALFLTIVYERTALKHDCLFPSLHYRHIILLIIVLYCWGYVMQNVHGFVRVKKYSNTSTKSCVHMVHCDQWGQGHAMQFAITSRPCIIIIFYILLYYWVWYPNYFILVVIMSKLFYIIGHYVQIMLYYCALYPVNVILFDIISWCYIIVHYILVML